MKCQFLFSICDLEDNYAKLTVRTLTSLVYQFIDHIKYVTTNMTGSRKISECFGKIMGTLTRSGQAHPNFGVNV